MPRTTCIIALAFRCLAFMITSCSLFPPQLFPSLPHFSPSPSPSSNADFMSFLLTLLGATGSARSLLIGLHRSTVGSTDTFGSDSSSRMRQSAACAFYIRNQIARGTLRALGKISTQSDDQNQRRTPSSAASMPAHRFQVR